ncbi:MAG: response regulator [Anaerolineales bacterium]|nr:MAG: response regulator [Anaerolineales bacterium]
MHLLVVDPNVAFGTLLGEELMRLGYSVDQASSGYEALHAAQAKMPTMAILDMALEDPDVLTVAAILRELDDSVRLMLIPLMGESLATEAQSLSIQGVLPKPFFLPELPSRINTALGLESLAEDADVSIKDDGDDPDVSLSNGDLSSRMVDAVIPQPEDDVPEESEHGFSYKRFQNQKRRVLDLMDNLIFDVGADAGILTYNESILSWVGEIAQEQAESIARAVIAGWRTSGELARILGQEQLQFEQSTAGGNYLLYALSIDNNAILAIAIRGSSSLGMIRHRAREVAGQISRLCSVL